MSRISKVTTGSRDQTFVHAEKIKGKWYECKYVRVSAILYLASANRISVECRSGCLIFAVDLCIHSSSLGTIMSSARSSRMCSCGRETITNTHRELASLPSTWSHGIPAETSTRCSKHSPASRLEGLTRSSASLLAKLIFFLVCSSGRIVSCTILVCTTSRQCRFHCNNMTPPYFFGGKVHMFHV